MDAGHENRWNKGCIASIVTGFILFACLISEDIDRLFTTHLLKHIAMPRQGLVQDVSEL